MSFICVLLACLLMASSAVDGRTFSGYFESEGSSELIQNKTREDADDAVDPETAGICPSNWKYMDGRCYYISEQTAAGWLAARADCRARGGDLAVPTSMENNQHIYEAMKERNVNIAYIGMYRVAKGLGSKFYTVSGSELSFTNWYKVEPNDAGGHEDCVEIMYKPPIYYYRKHFDAGGQWNDYPCNYAAPRHYICQMTGRHEFSRYFNESEGNGKLTENKVHEEADNAVDPQTVDICPSNWKYMDGRCYYISKQTAAGWLAARADCRARGGDLAVPTSMENNQHIYEAMKERNINIAYIGMYRVAEGLGSKFYTVSGSEVSFTNWYKVEPNDAGGHEDCVEMMYKPPMYYYRRNFDAGGQWNDYHCNNIPRHYICQNEGGGSGEHTENKVREEADDAVDSQTAGICPSNWKYMDDHCYYISEQTAAGWLAARADCRSRGGDLAVPTNMENNQHIYEAMKERNVNIAYIGMYRVAEGLGSKFYTVSGSEVSFTNWYKVEPNDAGGHEDCVEMMYKPPMYYYGRNFDAGGQWNDYHCNNIPRHYICQATIQKPDNKIVART